MEEADARRTLAIWLLTSGRYRRYLDGVLALPPRAMSVPRLLADFEAFAARVWTHVSLAGERDAELFRWQAVQRLGEEGIAPSAPAVYQVEFEMLAEHGVGTWPELERWAETNGLPVAWFQDFRSRAARARTRGYRSFAQTTGQQ